MERAEFVRWPRIRTPLLMSLLPLLIFWCVLTTLSRGAWIGLTFGVLAMVLSLGKRAAGAIAVLIAAVFLLVTLGLVGALPPTVTDRFALLVSQLSIFDPRGVTPT